MSVRAKLVGVLALAGAAAWVAAQPAPASQAARKPTATKAACPVPGARVSSGWGPRDGGFHDGVDLAAPYGTPIHAVAAGTVTFSATADPTGYGQFINILDTDGSLAQYGHMRTRLARAGEHVTAGQVVARVGAEGQATGPHLHLRIYPGPIHTRGVDPVRWLAARGVRLPCR